MKPLPRGRGFQVTAVASATRRSTLAGAPARRHRRRLGDAGDDRGRSGLRDERAQGALGGPARADRATAISRRLEAFRAGIGDYVPVPFLDEEARDSGITGSRLNRARVHEPGPRGSLSNIASARWLSAARVERKERRLLVLRPHELARRVRAAERSSR